MKLIYDQIKDKKEIRALCRALISFKGYGEIVDCMSLRIWTNEVFGIDIDHHEFSEVLESLTKLKEAETIISDAEFTQYRLTQ